MYCPWAAEQREVPQGLCYAGMVRTESRLTDTQGALEERLGLRVLALGLV